MLTHLRRGTMEAIYFGNAHWHGNSGAGEGPWAGADLEQVRKAPCRPRGWASFSLL